ncbi:MAG TPA: TetR/AcrR family transcriptional regulator [Acidimicrobiales bacterium]|nr:TetR/AcrR family transcriptional regulator [Acidimicrobiales bacterium]
MRERILDAGERTFAEKGYAGTTVDDVIGAALTSRATFYRYFRGKDDLFLELSRRCFFEMRTLIRQFGALDPAAVRREQLEDIVGAYTDLHARHGGVIRAWAERAAPPDSPLKDDAARTFGALLHEMAGALASLSAAEPDRSEVRAALLFLLIENSAQYLSNRHSRIDPARLAPTLSTMMHRAWFGGPAPVR